MEKSQGEEGERRIERTRICTHVCLRTYVSVCCRQEVKYAWCCAILENNGAVPADPADSAVPSASPEVKPSSSIWRHVSGSTDLRARETVSLFLCSPIFLPASTCHLMLLL